MGDGSTPATCKATTERNKSRRGANCVRLQTRGGETALEHKLRCQATKYVHAYWRNAETMLRINGKPQLGEKSVKRSGFCEEHFGPSEKTFCREHDSRHTAEIAVPMCRIQQREWSHWLPTLGNERRGLGKSAQLQKPACTGVQKVRGSSKRKSSRKKEGVSSFQIFKCSVR